MLTVSNAGLAGGAISVSGINNESSNPTMRGCQEFPSDVDGSRNNAIGGEHCGGSCAGHGFDQRQIWAATDLDAS